MFDLLTTPPNDTLNLNLFCWKKVFFSNQERLNWTTEISENKCNKIGQRGEVELKLYISKLSQSDYISPYHLFKGYW